MSKAYLSAIYELSNSTPGVTIVVQESSDCPTITEIVHRENGISDQTITIDDADIPMLIEALTRRLNDSRDAEAKAKGLK